MLIKIVLIIHLFIHFYMEQNKGDQNERKQTR